MIVLKGNFFIKDLKKWYLGRANVTDPTFGWNPIPQSNQFRGDEESMSASLRDPFYFVENSNVSEERKAIVPKEKVHTNFLPKEV